MIDGLSAIFSSGRRSTLLVVSSCLASVSRSVMPSVSTAHKAMLIARTLHRWRVLLDLVRVVVDDDGLQVL